MVGDKELMGASTVLLVLGILAQKASYGYEIVKHINDRAQGLLVWREGTLYPVLHKLEKLGQVRAQWQESESGRQRKYYFITAAGRAALRKDLKQWSGVNQLILNIVGAAHA
jgi:DNA-binding PadR family transcriptional regulator